MFENWHRATSTHHFFASLCKSLKSSHILQCKQHKKVGSWGGASTNIWISVPGSKDEFMNHTLCPVVSVQKLMDQILPCRECLGKFGPGPLCPTCGQLQRFRDYLRTDRCPSVIGPQIRSRIGELHRAVLEDAEIFWASTPLPAGVRPVEEHPSTAPKRLASPKASGGPKPKGVGEGNTHHSQASSPRASGDRGPAGDLSSSGIEVKKEPSEDSPEKGEDTRAPTPEKPKRRKHRHHRQDRPSPSPRRKEQKKEKRKRSRESSSDLEEKPRGRERKSQDRSASERSIRRTRPPPGPPPSAPRGHRPRSPSRDPEHRGQWKGIIPAGHKREDLRDPRAEAEKKKRKKVNKGVKKREQQAAYKRQFQRSLWGRR